MKALCKLLVIVGAGVFWLSVPGQAQAAVQSNDAASCPKATGPEFFGDRSNTSFSAMPPNSLKNANFEGAILPGAIFVGQDLTGASLHKADLGPSANGVVDFSNANLTTTCFIGAQLEATDFTFAAMACTDTLRPRQDRIVRALVAARPSVPQ